MVNNYPMREWHLENMKKTITRYVHDVSYDASPFQKRLYRLHAGNLSSVRKSIEFDIRHGVTTDDVVTFFNQIRKDLKDKHQERLDMLEKHFLGTVVKHRS